MNWFSYVPYAFRAMQYRDEIEALVEEATPVIKKVLVMIPEVQKLIDKAMALAKKIAPEMFQECHPAPTRIDASSSMYDVEWLQKTLNAKMPNLPPLKVDGINGPATKQRVEDYQLAHGLQVDGWAGIQTMASLLG